LSRKDLTLSSAATLQPVTPERHGDKRWLSARLQDYAGNNPVLGLAMGELVAAVAHYPLAFVRGADQACALVALVGLQQGQNLMIGANGQWLAPYVPALVRAYPFAVGRTEDGQQLLCVDESIALAGDGQTGERFFDDNGALAAPVQQVLAFLNQLESSRAITITAANALFDAGVLEPWTIQIEGLASEHWLPGLLRINEAALNALPNEKFLELRHVGALPLAYGQMLSTGNLQKLVDLARVHVQRAQSAAAQAPVQAVAQAASGPAPVTADFSGDTLKFH
jgi:hypothetical protein